MSAETKKQDQPEFDKTIARSSNLVIAALLEKIADLRDRADHDPLTGLLNYDTWLERVKAARTPHYGLFFVDLTNFKAINDRTNHNVGDEVLRGISNSLRKNVEVDIVARRSGDEFIVATDLTARDGSQKDMDDQDRVNKVEDRIIESIQPFCDAVRSVFDIPEFEVAIGNALLKPEVSVEDGLRLAEQAMLPVKAAQHHAVGQHRP